MNRENETEEAQRLADTELSAVLRVISCRNVLSEKNLLSQEHTLSAQSTICLFCGLKSTIEPCFKHKEVSIAGDL